MWPVLPNPAALPSVTAQVLQTWSVRRILGLRMRREGLVSPMKALASALLSINLSLVGEITL